METQQTKPDAARRLNMIRQQLIPATECQPVIDYLAKRGLELSPAIKAHPNMSYWDTSGERPLKVGEYPAMVCTVVNPEGKPISYHITYLSPNGDKADVPVVRKVLPPTQSLDGAAIRLFKANHPILGVAEGVETALACHAMDSIPVWSLLNTHGMKTFHPPDGVETISIYADNDASFAGQLAAYTLAHRLVKSVQVYVNIPRTVGDYADGSR